MRFVEDRMLGFLGGVTLLAITNVFSFVQGQENERDRKLENMWENPPGVAWCKVYPDGGKRCEPAGKIEQISKIECIRMCAGRARMEPVKPK